MSLPAIQTVSIQGNRQTNKINATEISILFTKSNLQIADSVKRSLPENTYTNISVESLRYDFGGRVEKTETRCISLKLNTNEKITSVIKGILSGLNLATFPELDQKINKNELETELLKVITRENTPDGQIELAFNQARSIELYIAHDLSASELKLDTSHAQTAQSIGRKILVITGIVSLYMQAKRTLQSLKSQRG